MAEEMAKEKGIGSIRIADEVVSIIAGMASTAVEGVAGMSAGIVGGIAEVLGHKSFTKGVKVEVGEKEAAVDLFIIVKYGVRTHHARTRRESRSTEHGEPVCVRGKDTL